MLKVEICELLVRVDRTGKFCRWEAWSVHENGRGFILQSRRFLTREARKGGYFKRIEEYSKDSKAQNARTISVLAKQGWRVDLTNPDGIVTILIRSV